MGYIGVITYNPLIPTFDPNFLGHPKHWCQSHPSEGIWTSLTLFAPLTPWGLKRRSGLTPAHGWWVPPLTKSSRWRLKVVVGEVGWLSCVCVYMYILYIYIYIYISTVYMYIYIYTFFLSESRLAPAIFWRWHDIFCRCKPNNLGWYWCR